MSAFKRLFAKRKTTTSLLKDGTEVLADGTLALEGSTLAIHKDGRAIRYPAEEMRNVTCTGNKLIFDHRRDGTASTITVESACVPDVYAELHPLLPRTRIRLRCHADYYRLQQREFVLTRYNADVAIVSELQEYIRVDSHHYEEIRSDMQFYIDKGKKSFVWLGSDCQTYMIVFHKEMDFLEYMSVFLEVLRGESEYVGSDYGVVEKSGGYRDIEKDDYEENAGYSFTDHNDHADNDLASNDSNADNNDNNTVNVNNGGTVVDGPRDEPYNSLVYTDSNTAFVARGDTVGVFDTSDSLRFNCAIKNVHGQKRKFLRKDSNLLFLDETRNRLNFLDLEKGRVTEQLSLSQDINDMLMHRDGLLGISDRSLFIVDERTKDVGRTNTYKTKTHFTRGSTSSTYSAIGSVKGDLRVYKDVFKRARILVSGLGDSVEGIDIGDRYAILTFRAYLILFRIEERKSERKIVRLQLRPEHAAYVGRVSFTKAKFNSTNTDIITSTGRHVITWKMADVLAGNVYAYRMREYGTEVVDDSFVGEERVLVTLKDDLKMLNKKNIR